MKAIGETFNKIYNNKFFSKFDILKYIFSPIRCGKKNERRKNS